MNRKAFGKRILSCAMAVILAFACVLSTWAGSETSPYNAAEEGELSVTSSGGRYRYQVNGGKESSTSSNLKISPSVGSIVTLTAMDTKTRQFMYWKDEYSNRIYSYEKQIRIVIGTNVHLRAEFARITGTSHFISCVNYGDSLLVDAKEAAYGEYVVPPQGSKVPGFTFTGWTETTDSIRNSTEHMIVYPKYTVNAETFTVEITNDAYVSGAGTYNNFQTVNLKAEPVNGSGEAFAYWQNADGEIVSYDRNYSFRINYDTVLTAVYGEEVTPEPIIRTSKIYRDPDDTKITFYAERSVPEGYTVLSHGILMSTASDVTDRQMVLSNAGHTSTSIVRKCSGNSNENSGTFSLAKGSIAHSVVVTARPFIVTQDAEGSMFVTYGDVMRASNAEAVTDEPLY